MEPGAQPPNLALTPVAGAELDNGAVSCMYGLHPGNVRLLHTEMVCNLQVRLQQFGLTTATIDFEQEAYKALQHIFGRNNININGCFFHI